MELSKVNITGDSVTPDDRNVPREDFSVEFNATSGGVANLSQSEVEQLAELLVDESDAKFHRVISVLHVYVLPIIIIIGIIGNTVSFLVYVSTPRLYRQSSSLCPEFDAEVERGQVAHQL